MKWIVGLDLRHTCDGPLHFASWLARETAKNGPGDKFQGVHVLEQESLVYALGLQGMIMDGVPIPTEKDVMRHARAGLEQLVHRTETGELFGEPEIVVDTSAEARLGAMVATTPRGGLIMGRRAKAGEDRFIRLGRVARRMLRKLPGPVITTPPDLTPDLLGDGPIVAATDAEDDSLAACHFARALANRLGRPLVLAYIVALPEDWVHGLGSSHLKRVREQLQTDGERRIARWVSDHGFDGCELVVAQGDIAPRVAEIAADRDSPLVVCGSRKMNPFTRMFVASAASEMAATLRRPLAVVPPDYSVG